MQNSKSQIFIALILIVSFVWNFCVVISSWFKSEVLGQQAEFPMYNALFLMCLTIVLVGAGIVSVVKENKR